MDNKKKTEQSSFVDEVVVGPETDPGSEENSRLQRQDRAAKGKGWAWMRQKWVAPVVYVSAAAIILTVMWQWQMGGEPSVTPEQLGLEVEQLQPDLDLSYSGEEVESLPVTAPDEESMALPYAADLEAVIATPFFDESADAMAQEEAIIQYEDSFVVHSGIDVTTNENLPFDVLSSMSGEVTLLQEDPLVGNVVEITHEGGLVTVYQSLSQVNVSEGQQVEQGQVIGQAGRNSFEADKGVHLHFEVRQDGEPVSPAQYLPDLPSAAATEE